MRLARVLRISRPRFWIYELGPYMIGVLGAVWVLNLQPYPVTFSHPIGTTYLLSNLITVILFAFYFLIPANIWIYGINDIYDYETDKLNPKKLEGYEALVTPKEQKSLWKWILLTTIPFVLIAAGYQFSIGFFIINLLLSFLVFLFFSGQYSAKPIRAKARPVLDSFFSAGHYIATAIFGYFLINPTGQLNRYYIIAGMARAMAMHAFSAVPDIQADKDAKLATIATFLGGKATIWACFGLYFVASVLSYSFLGWLSLLLGIVYCGVMIGTAIILKDTKKLFELYKRFPWVNTLSGMILFFAVLVKIL